VDLDGGRKPDRLPLAGSYRIVRDLAQKDSAPISRFARFCMRKPAEPSANCHALAMHATLDLELESLRALADVDVEARHLRVANDVSLRAIRVQ
jgi:hypothetical protein